MLHDLISFDFQLFEFFKVLVVKLAISNVYFWDFVTHNGLWYESYKNSFNDLQLKQVTLQ